MDSAVGSVTQCWVAGVGFCTVLAIAHLICEIFSARTVVLKRLGDDYVNAPFQPPPPQSSQRAPAVLVTGGAGFLGAAIVRQLVDKGFRVRVLDREVPLGPYRIAGVDYRRFDLVSGPRAELTEIFRGCGAVCHTAGAVCLADDYGLLFNIHVVATQRVIRAARDAGVGSLVMTSSSGAVTSPYVSSRHQQNIKSDFRVPAGWQFFSHYSQTKYDAEQMVVRSDEGDGGQFRTCALRLPGVYGVGDRMLVDLLVDGTMTFAPGARSNRSDSDASLGRRIDFVYVENAAHAHRLAIAALLSADRQHRVGGRTFNVSNCDTALDSKAMWDSFLAALAADAGDGRLPRKLLSMPYNVCLCLALVSEFLFWFLAGRVPCRSSAFWNLTRATLDLTTVSITLDTSETKDALGYQPLYDNAASFRHILTQLRRSAVADEDEHALQQEIDWRPRLPASSGWQRVFDKLSGPGMSRAELVVVLCAAGLALRVAWQVASVHGGHWGLTQCTICFGFAFVNGCAAVQCSTPTSKRWYHARRRLGAQQVALMVLEVIVQVTALAVLFDIGAGVGPTLYVARVAGPLAAAMVVVHLTDLEVQRPVGVLAFLFLLHWWEVEKKDSMEDGMRWAAPLLAIKYLISHVPRHEPYR